MIFKNWRSSLGEMEQNLIQENKNPHNFFGCKIHGYSNDAYFLKAEG